MVSLAVSAPKKARVEVRCTRGCRPQATTARTVRFPGLGGAVLPDGAALKIYVTARNQIGAYIEYRIGHGELHQDPALPGAGLEEARVLRMTATARGRVAIASLIVVLVFGAAFAVRKATAGGAATPALPTTVVLPSTPVSVSGLALPAATLPALRRPPHPAAPAQSTAPSPTPAAPTPTPAAPSTPAAPPSSSGGGKGGPVLVG